MGSIGDREIEPGVSVVYMYSYVDLGWMSDFVLCTRLTFLLKDNNIRWLKIPGRTYFE